MLTFHQPCAFVGVEGHVSLTCVSVQFCIQHDWPIDVDAKDGKFWLSARTLGQPSCHGSVVAVKEGLLGQDGFVAEMNEANSILTLSHEEEPNLTFAAHRPVQDIQLTDKQSVRVDLEPYRSATQTWMPTADSQPGNFTSG
jgi:hypothetical protein